MIDRGWLLERGATPLDDSSTRFSVWAPLVHELSVVIEPGAEERELAMARDARGVFEAVAPNVGPDTDYFYRLDGERDRPDPVSRWQPHGVHGPSRVVDRRFDWTDAGWHGIDAADLILYEVHVGTFTAEGTFDAAAQRLDYVRELGVTAIELMPVAEFPGHRNWGYDGVHPFAPQSSYGGPRGLKRFVDAAHNSGLAVVLDVVYNHLGPEGNYLTEFAPYFTDRYGTPWGKAINFDGPDSDEVRRYFIDNALYWISEFHIDGLRLDAVQMIFDRGARHILAELAAAVHAQGATLDRRVQVIAESDLNDPRLVRAPEIHGLGLDAMWNDDFHHAVHVALTGERSGYYVDFDDDDAIRQVMAERFVLDGRYSEYRRRRHGAPAADLAGDHLVVFVQNHDQVGNRAAGERLSSLVSLEQQKLAAALLLLSPFIPLLFMGEEYGETRPFLYFVDHGEPELREAVRRGRKREFERFDWQGPVPDPGAVETFKGSRLDPDQAGRSPHKELLTLYTDLIRSRREEPALRPGTATCHVDGSSGWLAFRLERDGNDLLAAFNLTRETASIETALGSGGWRLRLATDDSLYGGSGPTTPARLTGEGSMRLEIPSYTAVLYRREAE
ncbi:MAG: malto-oligosyltrehalose trehalohydrolase [Gemmatimonadales bacterium]|jgi:maltooligosyltrehalose trehalohydrolase